MPSVIESPPRRLLFLEGRVVLEWVALLPAFPLLRRAPRGDGHPVLVLPGFMAGDGSTLMLRRFLRGLGYRTHGWRLGRNVGPSSEMARSLAERLSDLRRRYDRRVTLIGWSLGGIYARELARRFPEDVRQVITIASPFRDPDATNVPTALLLRRRLHPDESAFRERLAAPLQVPSTAIYSRTDGIVSWRSCCEDVGPQRESIEVESSHLGMGHHPVVLLTIAERLRQAEGAWRPFQPPEGWRWPLAPRVATPPTAARS
jgi:hypothetical protein